MNTKVVKSFGLALIVAVGVLALLLATGTFNPQKAGADGHGNVSLSLDTTKAGEAVEATVTVAIPNLPPGGTITIDLAGLTVPGSGVDARIEGGMTWPTGTADSIEVTLDSDNAATGVVNLGTVDSTAESGTTPGNVVITIPADTDTNTPAVDHDGDTDTDDLQQGLAAGRITITLKGLTNPDVAIDATAKVTTDVDGTDTEEGPDDRGTSNAVGTGVVLSTSTAAPGAAARVTIEVGTGNGEDVGSADSDVEIIVIDMGAFGLPSSIDEDDVTVRGINAAGAETGRLAPASVNIAGSKITITVDDMNQPVDPDGFQGVSPHFRIVFNSGAGVTIPMTAGSYSVKIVEVTDEEGVTTDFDVRSNGITVAKSLTISPVKGASGTAVTVTGEGFPRDINSLFIDTRTDTSAPDGDPGNDEYVIASDIDVEDGSFSETFTVDSNFKGGLNYINTLDINGESYSKISDMEQEVIDAANKALTEAGDDATDDQKAAPNNAIVAALEEGWVTFQVTGNMTVDKTSVRLGDTIEITLADFSDGGVSSAKIGNLDLEIDTEGTDAQDQSVDNGSLKFTATIPPNLTIGKHKIRVTIDPTDGSDDETGSVDIVVEGLPLTIDPSTVVPGQEVTIRGSGFTAEAALASITIGGEEAALGSVPILVSNSGAVVATVSVPKTVSAEGSNVLVVVTENAPDVTPNKGNSRAGVMKITIPKETLTLDPLISRPDTTVTASGTGFVAGANVNITYGESTTSTSANSLGVWSKDITVPINTAVGTKNEVKATSGVNNANEADKEATATHEVPGGTVTLSPEQGQPGTTITVSGVGFQAYAAVVKMTVGGLSVLTGATNTNANGDFTASILLPALPAGTQTFFVGVGGTADNPVNRESLTFTVTDAPAPVVSADPADVFADLIEAGTLVEVLQLIRTSDTDITWLFYKPGEMFEDFNTYSEASSGDILFVNVSSQTTFQDRTLYTGWNQHVLN